MCSTLLQKLLLLICTTLTANQTTGASIQEYDFANNCSWAPPKPIRTEVETENFYWKFFDFLNRANDTFMSKNASPPSNVTLIMGYTGCGKTTLTQILASDLTQLHAKITPSMELVIINANEQMGAPNMMSSKALIPQLVISSDDNSTSYYDCPGFDATRGPLQDLAVNMFMNQIPKMVKSVKMLFLIDYDMVLWWKKHKKLNYYLSPQYATKYVKNIGQFSNSIGLVATKVNKYFLHGINRWSDIILRNIVEFLTAYNESLHHRLVAANHTDVTRKASILRKIEFVNVLLRKDSSGKYNHIAFSRGPELCGPLSSSETTHESKALVKSLCDRLEFSPVGNSRENFGYALADKTVITIHEFVTDINYAITAKVREAVVHWQNEWMWMCNSLRRNNLPNIVKQLQNSWSDISNLQKNLKETPSKLASSLKEMFQKYGYILPEEMEEFMSKQEQQLSFFDEATGTTVKRSVEAWHAPLLEAMRELEEYRDWYSFCLTVKTTVDSAEFHTRRPPLPQEKSVDWVKFIGLHNIVRPFPDHITNIWKKFQGYPLSFSYEKNILDEIMRWALQPIKISCDGSGSTVISGNFIRFGEFIDSKGQINKDGCKYPTIKVYAGDTVFIDANLNVVGAGLSLVVIAPQWQVIGEPHLNFNGDNASDIEPRKAKDDAVSPTRDRISGEPGTPGVDGNAGADGLPGRPGGNGGNFLGVAGKIIEADKLTITSNGGNGGRGQDGGNGASGRDGGNYYADVGTFGGLGGGGGNGGNGGNGGAGGFGGKPGSIQIIASSDYADKVNIQRLEGNMGGNGLGGKGGNAGRRSSNTACKNQNVHMIVKIIRVVPPFADCDTTKQPDGNVGDDGVSGGNMLTRTKPFVVRLGYSVNGAKASYANLFKYSPNRATSEFIATF